MFRNKCHTLQWICTVGKSRDNVTFKPYKSDSLSLGLWFT